MIELYGMQSPNVRKVGILLEELGLDYRLRHVAVFKGEQFDDEFLAMNPFGKVPVLVDSDNEGGTPIFESGAILIYLAETYGEFLPAGGSKRYQVLSWLMGQMALVGPMLGQYNHFQILGDRAEPYAASRYRNQSKRIYRLLDDRLSGEDWLATGRYTIADMAVYPWALYLEQHGFDPADHPHLLRWRETIGARKSVQRMLARFSDSFDDVSTTTRRTATQADLDRFFGREADAPAADFSVLTKA